MPQIAGPCHFSIFAFPSLPFLYLLLFSPPFFSLSLSLSSPSLFLLPWHITNSCYLIFTVPSLLFRNSLCAGFIMYSPKHLLQPSAFLRSLSHSPSPTLSRWFASYFAEGGSACSTNSVICSPYSLTLSNSYSTSSPKFGPFCACISLLTSFSIFPSLSASCLSFAFTRVTLYSHILQLSFFTSERKYQEPKL